MLVRRYQGRNEDEAIAKAKADLGANAVILHIKELSKNGIFNLTNAAKVEVIVGLDQDFHEQNNGGGFGRGEEFRYKEVQDHSFRAYALSSYSNLKETEKSKGKAISERSKQRQDKVGSDSPLSKGGQGDFNEEVSNSACGDLAAQRLYQHLLYHEVQEEVAQKLSLSIQQLISDESSLCLQEAVNICLEELIRTSGGLNIAPAPACEGLGGAAVIAFVGPTGVGKTTTIAKLAAHYHLQEKQKISLITVDTYRIAAVEQLKTYAMYIGIPLEVALTPQEMHQLIRKYKDRDLILIDTPGRSQKDSMRIQELATILSAAQPTEVHLLLNVTTQYRILCDIVRGFSVLSPNRLLFTKLDESASFGHILNCSVAIGKPVSYLTTGQDVPDDIELATTERITEYLLQEEDVHLL
ncbi:TPA: flagellar biosynthesis protein FlhF [Candidatus Poribacteria bacterium]|nr:flagellar biosynthesis protein FlhF [Candidatus Poribacteria bacterium]